MLFPSGIEGIPSLLWSEDGSTRIEIWLHHDPNENKEMICTAPEMIPTPKWSPTRTDPQIDPEMIPTPKWSPNIFTLTPKWSPSNLWNGVLT